VATTERERRQSGYLPFSPHSDVIFLRSKRMGEPRISALERHEDIRRSEGAHRVDELLTLMKKSARSRGFPPEKGAHK